MFLHKKHRREIVQLNVIPLIDISSMIIIFLIMGTIFGESAIDVPKDVFVPKSMHNDSVNNAPRIIVTQGYVQADFLKKSRIDLKDLNDETSEASLKYQKMISDYVKKIPASEKGAGVLLNLVADQTTSYKVIFDVVSVFRKSGFDSILFVAMGK